MLRTETATAVVLATRDLRLCQELGDEVLVLEHGAVVDRMVLRDPAAGLSAGTAPDDRRSA